MKEASVGKRITAERLRELLNYDRETGIFTWRKRTSNRVTIGERAGRDNGNGYRRIAIDGRSYYEHHLAWLYVHAEFPEFEIDHRDGVGANNCISNLRPATHAENGQNQSLRVTNRSGKHGVSWSKSHRKWAAYIVVEGRKRHLGLFDDVEDAGAAYLSAKQDLHKFQPIPRDAANA